MKLCKRLSKRKSCSKKSQQIGYVPTISEVCKHLRERIMEEAK